MSNNIQINENKLSNIPSTRPKDPLYNQTEHFSIKEVKATPKDMSNFNINKNFLKNMGIQTLLFVKKNRFVKIDFLSVIKYSIILLLIEFFIYCILQLIFSQVASLRKFIKNSSIAFPIGFSILFIIAVVLILIIQLKKKMALLLIFKIFEFLSFSIILSKYIE